MAHSFTFKDQAFGVGDTISVTYRIKEDDKFRNQTFQGIVIKVRGSDKSNRMVTVRKNSRAGIGVERIIPLESPFVASIKLDKKSTYNKARLYFIRDLSQKKLRHKLYRSK